MEKKLRFCDQAGRELDIRAGDISIGLDLVKNALHRALKEKDDPDAKERADGLFRLKMFLDAIRAGLGPAKGPTND